jgi:hypothetical protein
LKYEFENQIKQRKDKTMNIEWNKQSYQSLKEFWQRHASGSDLSAREIALTSRCADIEAIIESDQIWPHGFYDGKRQFMNALREVLSRLPQEDFDKVQSEVGFVLEDPAVDPFAVNIPAPTGPDRLSPGSESKIGKDVVVFFRNCLRLSPDALIGLVAHELAHSFVNGEDDIEDEALVDAKARSWGFERETDCKEHEKKHFRNSPQPKV